MAEKNRAAMKSTSAIFELGLKSSSSEVCCSFRIFSIFLCKSIIWDMAAEECSILKHLNSLNQIAANVIL